MRCNFGSHGDAVEGRSFANGAMWRRSAGSRRHHDRPWRVGAERRKIPL